jgi:hypothetical protein
VAKLTLALLAVAGLLLAATPALGAEASAPPDPSPARPTCSERYPEDGPAGVDLRLGCIVSEVVGVYTAGQTDAPPRLTTYAIGTLAAIAGVVALVWFAGRAASRRAGARLAPVTPTSWWVCDRCKSVNGAGVARCYACGNPAGDGPTLPTAADPGITQSFGERRKRG